MRASSVLSLGLAALLVILPARSEECGSDIGARWSADPETGALSFTLTADCSIPAPHELVGLLADRHVHVAGDPVHRLAVQYFELAWEACEARPPQREEVSSTRADAASEDHAMCHLAYGRNVYSWLKRPMDRFTLSYESVFYIRDQCTSSEWWRKWAAGFDKISLEDLTPLSQEQNMGDAARMARLPDILVLGNWARHVENWQGKRTLVAFLEAYERELRVFAKALVESPSWERWWRHGRVVWRLALPAERHSPPQPLSLFYSQACVDGSNEVAMRVLGELAPEIRMLDQAALVQHADEDAAAAAPRPMLGNGVLYKPPVQLLLMRHALAFAVSSLHEIGRSDAAAEGARAAAAALVARAGAPPMSTIPDAPAHAQKPVAVEEAAAPGIDVAPAANASPLPVVGAHGASTTSPPRDELPERGAVNRAADAVSGATWGLSGAADSGAILGVSALMMGFCILQRSRIRRLFRAPVGLLAAKRSIQGHGSASFASATVS